MRRALVGAIVGTLSLVVGSVAVAADQAGDGALWGGVTGAGGEASAVAMSPQPWPGGSGSETVDEQARYGTDLSGLSFVAGSTPAGDRLWAVDDGDGRVLKLQRRSDRWVPVTEDGWGAGKQVTFPGGSVPDAEGLVVVRDAVYLATERDGSGAARPGILRAELDGAGGRVAATHEWRMRSEYPDVSANLGLESIAHVPDEFLVRSGFVDESRSAPYDPANHPGRFTDGVFLVAVEAPSYGGRIDGYVLNRDGSFVRVAEIANPLPLVTDLEFEADTGRLWASCDDYCQGRSATFAVSPAGAARGKFVATALYARPSGLPDHNNEGFAIAPHSRCVDGLKPVFWANDSNDAGHALRAGTLRCDPPAPLPEPVAPAPVEPAPVEPAPVEPAPADPAPADPADPAPTDPAPADPEPTDPEPTVPAPPAPTSSPDPRPAAAAVVVQKQKVQAGRRARIKVRVTTDDGPGVGRVKIRTSARTVTGRLVRGRATLDLGRFTKPGARRMKVTYAGEARPAAARATLRVVKARSTLEPVRRTIAVKRGAKARLVASFRANGLKPTGKVKVKIGGQVVKARVQKSGRRVVVRTPRLRARGLTRVRVVYTGGRSTGRDRAVFRVRVQ